VHDLISAPLTTHGDSTIQKLRYADPRNRTKIEKFSQKGECFFFSLAETLMSQIHTAPASLSPPPPVAEL
jgi:hypothetical protein